MLTLAPRLIINARARKISPRAYDPDKDRSECSGALFGARFLVRDGELFDVEFLVAEQVQLLVVLALERAEHLLLLEADEVDDLLVGVDVEVLDGQDGGLALDLAQDLVSDRLLGLEVAATSALLALLAQVLDSLEERQS